MLFELLARATPLHVARTRAERESIYRFRYSIYGDELQRDYPGMDREQGILKQVEDELPESRLWYTGSVQNVTGTCRARVYDDPPADVVEEYSLSKLPSSRIAVLERLMVRPTLRGRALLPPMIWHGYQLLMEEHVDFCILTCVPGLLRHYVRMGARPYAAKLIEGASTLEVPLIICMNDPAYLKSIDSFMYKPMRKLSKKSYDAKLMQPLFEPEAQRIRFEEPDLTAPLFHGIGDEARREIAKRSFVLHVEAGDLLVRKSTVERELYVVLEGELAVEGAEVRLGKDAMIGEVGFLGTEGVRTATVRAVTPSRVLVLRRKFLDDLAAKQPHLAYVVSRNLARILADRVAADRAVGKR
jgi:Cyclic nucleotide-binding domain